VPLIATFEPQHVLVSTTYSKAALRVVAEIAARSLKDIAYFPSYEIITGPQARGRYYAEDLREVTPDGVAHVMSIFKRHFLDGKAEAVRAAQPRTVVSESSVPSVTEREEEFQVVCDEEALDA
jgi:hypothetical protein